MNSRTDLFTRETRRSEKVRRSSVRISRDKSYLFIIGSAVTNIFYLPLIFYREREEVLFEVKLTNVAFDYFIFYGALIMLKVLIILKQ